MSGHFPLIYLYLPNRNPPPLVGKQLMKITFEKYEGAGNDFILIDQWDHRYELSGEVVNLLCDRHFGIGGDGLMLLRRHPEFDFEMVYYNADGAPGSMCGNGGRCIARMAFTKGYTRQSARFIASDGPHIAKIMDEWKVQLQMMDTTGVQRFGDDLFLDTGSPHYIRQVKQVSETDVVGEGRSIRYNDTFRANGTNVNFMMPFEDGYFVRTYERGVEDETLSCGTGVTAAALAAAWQQQLTGAQSVKIHTRGGLLAVHFNARGDVFTDIWLEGPAKKVFEGVITI